MSKQQNLGTPVAEFKPPTLKDLKICTQTSDDAAPTSDTTKMEYEMSYNLHVTYATFEDTLDVLLEAGFNTRDAVKHGSDAVIVHREQDGMSAVVFTTGHGYHSVGLTLGSIDDAQVASIADFDWMGPVVWNGPSAPWDKTNCTEDFLQVYGLSS